MKDKIKLIGIKYINSLTKEKDKRFTQTTLNTISKNNKLM